MAILLTDGQKRDYQQDGFVHPVRVLSPAEAQRFRTACDDLETHLGGKPRTIDVRQMHLHFRWAWELATHPRILDAAEDLLGPRLLVWATELFAKHPRDAAVSIGWHRDRRYMGFGGDNVTATAWVALSRSDRANGCMCAVPMSKERPVAANGSAEPRPPENPDGQEVVNVVLQPGEMSLHNPDVLHGSSPNESAEKRVGFVIRYVNPDARPVGEMPAMVLARGDVDRQRFRLVDPPTADDEATAIARMKKSAVQPLDAVLNNLKVARQK
jgi:hypothetical protein